MAQKILLISVDSACSACSAGLPAFDSYDVEKKKKVLQLCLPSVRFSESSTTFVHGSSKVE